jgi:hypothetical protein
MQVPRPIYGGMFGDGSINPYDGYDQMNQQPSNQWEYTNNQWSSNNQNNNNNQWPSNNQNNNNNQWPSNNQNNNNNLNSYNSVSNVNNQPITAITPANNKFINSVTTPIPSINNLNSQAESSSPSLCINAFRAKVFLNSNLIHYHHDLL